MKSEFTGYSIVMTGSCAADRIPAMLKKHAGRFSREFTKRFAPRSSFSGACASCDDDGHLEACDFDGSECAACDGGGITAALWSLGERLGCGMRVELDRITVSQLAVELCELEDLSPYEIGGGIGLMITNEPEKMLEELTGKGLEAAVIGKITDDNDRVIVFGEITRFISPR